MTYRTEFGDYDAMYGGLDYAGAAVLDIGADYGTTARYFLEHGAARVTVSERNPDWVAALHQLAAEDARVTVAPPLDPSNAEATVRDHDIVKVDCERCERFLLDVPDAVLSGPRAWVIETHTKPLFVALTALFRRLGYTVTVTEEFPENPPERYVKVFQAVKGAGR